MLQNNKMVGWINKLITLFLLVIFHLTISIVLILNRIYSQSAFMCATCFSLFPSFNLSHKQANKHTPLHFRALTANTPCCSAPALSVSLFMCVCAINHSKNTTLVFPFCFLFFSTAGGLWLEEACWKCQPLSKLSKQCSTI